MREIRGNKRGKEKGERTSDVNMSLDHSTNVSMVSCVINYVGSKRIQPGTRPLLGYCAKETAMS